MKYVEKHFTLRSHRRDGTSKLLLGVTGHPPKIGSLKQIKVAQDEVLTIKVVDHPRRDEPAEAIRGMTNRRFPSPHQPPHLPRLLSRALQD